MYKYSGRTLRLGRAWTDNDGIQHPASWGKWTDAEISAIEASVAEVLPTYEA